MPSKFVLIKGVCPVSVPSNDINTMPRQCAQPLAPGARFCVKHEADRIRLSR